MGAAFTALALTNAGCIERGVFECDLDSQCGPDGACEQTGFCSRPDDACASGRRYSEVSRFGAVCTEDDAVVGTSADATSTTTTSGGVTMGPLLDMGRGPAPGELCGNGQMDPGEVCDDGNREGGDGCGSYCIEPGATIWETLWDSSTNGEDRAFAIALDPDGEHFAIAGFSDVPGQGRDILVQLYDTAWGEVAWTRTFNGEANDDDSGDELVFDSAGDIVATGRVVDESPGGDVWLAKLDRDGNERWIETVDDAGRDDKGHSVDVGPDGRIFVGAHVTRTEDPPLDTDIWLAEFDGEGVFQRTIDYIPGDGFGRDEAIDVRLAPSGVLFATGMIRLASAAGASVWTAAYNAQGALEWDEVVTASDPSSEDRGVGIGFDLDGNPVVAGTAQRQIWVTRFQAPDGTPQNLVDLPGELHNEASDVVFAGDGSFVVTGFTGFGTTGFATGDIWVRCYGPAGAERWTVEHDGAAEEIDKALAVVDVGDGSVIVAGYVTTPGQLRDVWIRKIAL